jgi:hypothetical protein
MIKPLIEGRKVVKILEVGSEQPYIGIILEFDDQLNLIKFEKNNKYNKETVIIPLSSIVEIKLVNELA